MPVACPVRTHLPRLAWLVAMAIALTQALLGGPAAAEFMAFQGPFTAVGTFAPAGARCPGGVPFVRTYQYTFEVAAVVVDAMTTPPSAFRGDFSINWSDNCGGGSGITGGGTFVPLTVTGNAVTGTHVDGPWTDSISAIIREHEIVGTWTQTLDDGVWTGTASGQFVLPRFMFIESIRLETPRVVNGRTVTATVTLSSAAPPGGILIALEAKTTWPLLLPKPAAATVPSSVTVPAGQRTVTFSVDVGDVLFPVAAQITGTYSGQAITTFLTVLPDPIHTNGRVANARVQSILDFFFSESEGLTPHEKYAKALRDAMTIRGEHPPDSGLPASGTFDTGQDVHLAAAEHYLWAANWALEAIGVDPALVVILRGLVSLHEWAKLVAVFKATNLPPSPATRLSDDWGQQGITDALRIIYGDHAVKNLRCRLLGICSRR